jgi:hypothetical protein
MALLVRRSLRSQCRPITDLLLPHRESGRKKSQCIDGARHWCDSWRRVRISAREYSEYMRNVPLRGYSNSVFRMFHVDSYWLRTLASLAKRVRVGPRQLLPTTKNRPIGTRGLWGTTSTQKLLGEREYNQSESGGGGVAGSKESVYERWETNTKNRMAGDACGCGRGIKERRGVREAISRRASASLVVASRARARAPSADREGSTCRA